MNILDAFILIIILIFGFLGYRRGLVLSIISLTSVILSFIAAKLFYIDLAANISANTELDTKISLYITEKLNAAYPGGNVTLSADNSNSSIQWIVTKLFHSDTIINNTVNSISSQITAVILNIISFVILFIAVLIIIKLIGLILNKLAKLPVLNFINKVGGSAVGIIKGVLLCMILITIASSLSIFTKNTAVVSLFDNSFLYKYFDITNWLF